MKFKPVVRRCARAAVAASDGIRGMRPCRRCGFRRHTRDAPVPPLRLQTAYAGCAHAV
ncbi:hypothetical protein [Neisseria polysaccharea]|uniref:hypothetical protein n=1 Tax=Neisseria polysaccharea TaxID=489 RepID=UPI00272D0BFE|nr:hypothetical protein [Neisseria polysaccharea]